MKKLNIKALLIDHGEKMVFGLFAMIVLGILAGGTSWARYPKTPDQLKSSVENAKIKITSNNPWPKDKEESFKVIDFTEKSKLLFSMPQIARYDFSQWLFHPLYKKNEPKREPTFEAVQSLIASAAFVPLSVLSEEARQQLAEQTAAEAEAAEMPAESGEDSEFGTRASAAGAAGRGRFPGDMVAGAGTLGASHGAAGRPSGGHGAAGMAKPPGTTKSGGGQASGSGKKNANPAAGHASGPGLFGAGPGMMGPGMMGSAMMKPGMMGSGMMGGGSMGAGVSARGVRVMAVRGVFPIQKQIDNYKNALHVSQDEAADLLEIFEFVLERQAAMPGPDPWKDSQWVVVNIDSSLEVLEECSDLDFEDPVPTALRDVAITMDLPLNLLGVWKSFATHPLIKNEELTLEQIEEEAKLLEKVNEVAEEAKLNDSQPGRRGLAKKQRDFKKIVNQVNSNDESRGMMNQMMKTMKATSSRPTGDDSGGPRGAHGMSGPGMMGPGMMGRGMMGQGMGMRGAGGSALDRLVARRRYLLFRYFDFDVEFGMAYRYRVKLILRNPNFERSPDELADIEIAKGLERETPWSNISNPDVVRNKSNYFLKDVEREPYREDKVKPSSRPVALLSMYDWDTTMGTVFSDVLNMTAIGSFIGEDKKATLIPDLVAGTLEKGEHKFVTQDALLDVESDVDVAPDLHPDLKLSPEKGRANARLGLMEEALVVTSYGEVKTLGQSQGLPVNEYDKEALKFWKKQEEREHKVIKSKETAPVQATLAGDDEGKNVRRNPRRPGMSSSMMMPGYPGTPGAGAATPPKKGARPGGGNSSRPGN